MYRTAAWRCRKSHQSRHAAIQHAALHQGARYAVALNFRGQLEQRMLPRHRCLSKRIYREEWLIKLQPLTVPSLPNAAQNRLETLGKKRPQPSQRLVWGVLDDSR